MTPSKDGVEWKDAKEFNTFDIVKTQQLKINDATNTKFATIDFDYSESGSKPFFQIIPDANTDIDKYKFIFKDGIGGGVFTVEPLRIELSRYDYVNGYSSILELSVDKIASDNFKISSNFIGTSSDETGNYDTFINSYSPRLKVGTFLDLYESGQSLINLKNSFQINFTPEGLKDAFIRFSKSDNTDTILKCKFGNYQFDTNSNSVIGLTDNEILLKATSNTQIGIQDDKQRVNIVAGDVRFVLKEINTSGKYTGDETKDKVVTLREILDSNSNDKYIFDVEIDLSNIPIGTNNLADLSYTINSDLKGAVLYNELVKYKDNVFVRVNFTIKDFPEPISILYKLKSLNMYGGLMFLADIKIENFLAYGMITNVDIPGEPISIMFSIEPEAGIIAQYGIIKPFNEYNDCRNKSSMEFPINYLTPNVTLIKINKDFYFSFNIPSTVFRSREFHIIIHNDSQEKVVVAVPGGYLGVTNTDSIEIEPSGFAEINIL